MKLAYCTHCRKAVMVRITVTEPPAAGREGKDDTATIETHHCTTCGLFVGSEERARALKHA